MENNSFKLTLKSLSVNESFARNVISCFALRLNPSISEITDIKTAVSEAITNCIVHAYKNVIGDIEMLGWIEENRLHIKITDKGVGIENINLALEPFYTTSAEDERSGMGFTIIKSFMDEFNVTSKLGEGTEVYMCKVIGT